MQIPMIHKGYYLLCRTITDAYISPKLMGISTLIEDINDEIEELTLQNFHFDINKTSIFKKGALLIIKEPYLQYESEDKKNVIIRVDSPSDVVFVDETEHDSLRNANALCWYKKLSISFEEAKNIANDLFKKCDYEKALIYYNRALELEPNSAVIYLNRALVLIGLGRYYEAYEEAKKAESNGGDEEKTLFRLGKAAYGMRNWKLSLEHFSKLLTFYPKNAAAIKELDKIKTRLNEAQFGKYDLRKLYDEAYKNNIGYFDVADYVGPVEVADIPNKGKGLVVTRDVPRGTLLLVSKAFNLTYDQDRNNSHLIPYNMLTKEMDTGVEAVNILETVQALKRNPQRTRELYDLYAGDCNRDEEIPEGVVDVGRIENICTFNAFMPGNMFENTSMGIFAAGLWVLPSYINHSCLGNASRVFYGDIMMVYAVNDLKTGDEIMWNYVDLNCPYKKRVERLQRYRFTCNCQLCELDRTDPHYEEREELLQKIPQLKTKIAENPKKTLPNVISLVNQVKQTFKHRNKLQVRLLQVTGLLAGVYQMTDHLEKSLQVQEETLKILDEDGIKYQYYSPFLLMQMGKCYEIMCNFDMARICVINAFERIKIRTGIDYDLFKRIYPDVCNIID
uniref:SET domain-containing protein n=1 Tax=Acrobeloides nanus TaxID=290746 RepID=A0A914EKB5_9BILA